MKPLDSFQGKTIRCIKDFSFFKKANTYYCTHDTGDYFYVWCGQTGMPVNQIKLSKEHKKFFTCQ